MYRVILADDSGEFLEWFGSLLKRSPDFQVIGEAATGAETLRLVGLLLPDLVIADVDMPNLDGFDVVKGIVDQWPSIKVMLVSSHVERVYERLARDEGALAFIPKTRLSADAVRLALEEGA